MLKHWLEKMKKLFHTDERTSEDYPVYQRPEIKARMTYQYPQRNKFRFPVIPDETILSKEGKTTSVDERIMQKSSRSTAAKSTDREEQDRKIKRDETAPPFQVTEVPSPIYGFQKRKKQEESVPAFIRKRENEMTVEQASLLEEDVIELESKDEIEQVKKLPVAEKERITEAETGVNEIEEAEVLTEDETEEHFKTIQQLAKEEKAAPPIHKKEKRQLKSRKRSRMQQENSSNNKQIPFNVMMTPLDRVRHEQKQRSSQEKADESVTRAGKNEPVTQVDDEKPGDKKIPIHLLNDPETHDHTSDHWIKDQQHLLEQTLKHFHVAAKVVKATQGPTVTRFEVQPELGVKVSKIRNLSDDLKLNMAAKDIRIEAPIPGKNTVGIEVPNPQAQMVGFQEIVDTEEFKHSKSPLTIGLGVTIEGKPKITNIQKMPYGLIAGATGSGKSVCINTILISILYKASHEDVKFLLIDPKMVELAPYNGIPHLVSPVITDVKAATQSLKWAVQEMEDRYERFVEEGVRDIERFNRKVLSQGRNKDKMPYIVIVIDELADLMMLSPQDVENSISRIAQKARACGIHLLLATQRPSVDVITGLIKANIPTRIAFSVSSQVDSRTILDASGAEKLLGKGDMLFMENGTGKSVRLQGPYVSDDEIERVTAFAREIAEPEYLFEQEQLLEQIQLEEDEDELLEEAIEFVVQGQTASTSMLQRHFKIGYNRAARLIDTMEARGIISGQNGSKPRDVLISEITVE